ncbi:MAG: membrane protein insertion efficiency factor YidD [Alphaproteobacteria bacterium]|nr:MAG: membrane protein insertion efficiency factor YidD [Alphaproteobacteria bacterium]
MSQQDRLSAFLSYFGIGSRFLARGLIKAYRYSFSSLTGFDCRHLPTCSHYADEAIGRFGLWAGGWMTLARLSRCARWYLPWHYGRWRGTNAGPELEPSD